MHVCASVCVHTCVLCVRACVQVRAGIHGGDCVDVCARGFTRMHVHARVVCVCGGGGAPGPL